MDSLLIFVAFACGFTSTRIGLPPLVGYLIAGFGLHYFGVESSEAIEYMADLGILLLLFSIGLKLKVKNLLRVEIWGSATLHMGLTILIFTTILLFLATIDISGFANLSWVQSLLLAFGLSFSSTVFAVKAFEERGDLDSLHGSITIAVLIIQDIAAVLYLTFSTGKFPSPWAITVIPALLILRPLLLALLARSGHRELLLLYGLFVPIGLGAGGFELVGLKPDLGALVLGIVVASSPKAGELSEVLLSLKDLLLVGFFLYIGLSGLPTISSFSIAVLLVVLSAIKSVCFFGLFTRFKLRSRTALHSTLALSNYSEFGLLVCTIGVKSGVIDKQWLVTMALALSLSFLVASPINNKTHAIYARFRHLLKKFESEDRLPYDQPIDTGDANVLIFGMGRIGSRIYDCLESEQNLKVIGLDFDSEKVAEHKERGRHVICDDATDSDLWEKISTHTIELVMLTMASHAANMYTIERLQDAGFQGAISATAKFPDDLAELKEAGVTLAYDLYSEAGQGFADDILAHLASR